MVLRTARSLPFTRLYYYRQRHDDRPGGSGDGWAVHEQRIEELASEVAALRKELREVDASLASLRRNLGE